MYFVPPWTTEDGGSLDLFDTDSNGCPNTIIKSLLPRMNTMACFEVTPISFHQVAEVLSKEKTRLSIGGWFHGTTLPRPPKYKEPYLKLMSPKSISEGNKVKLNLFHQYENPSFSCNLVYKFLIQMNSIVGSILNIWTR